MYCWQQTRNASKIGKEYIPVRANPSPVNSNEIREIHGRKKKIGGLLTIGLFILLALLIVSYILFLENMLQGTILANAVRHVTGQIAGFSLLGSFYTALFGGLFFIFVPMEAYFLKAIFSSHPAAVYSVFITGMLFSYTLDYIIGMKMSKFSKRLISAKKFYSTKTYINRYGRLAVFIAHAVPFLPSQQVTFILGVFRYNPMKFLMLALPAQLIKYSALIAIAASVS